MTRTNDDHCRHCLAAEGEAHMFGCPVLPQAHDADRGCRNCRYGRQYTDTTPCIPCVSHSHWKPQEDTLPLDTQRAAEDALFRPGAVTEPHSLPIIHLEAQEAAEGPVEPVEDLPGRVAMMVDPVAPGALLSALSTQVAGSHYKETAIQPVEFIYANGIGFMEGSAIKYLTRHQQKGGAADVRKALHFCQLILELEYGEHA